VRGNQSSFRRSLAEAKYENGKTSCGIARSLRLSGSEVGKVRGGAHLPAEGGLDSVTDAPPNPRQGEERYALDRRRRMIRVGPNRARGEDLLEPWPSGRPGSRTCPGDHFLRQNDNRLAALHWCRPPREWPTAGREDCGKLGLACHLAVYQGRLS
jgi:hypothetical protein